MNPERRTFELEHGRVYEAAIGVVRDCFLVEPSGHLTLGRLEQNLRRDHGAEVGIAANIELGLSYIVSLRADGKFTDNQMLKIAGAYKEVIRIVPSHQRGVVIKGPWPDR
jgi:hypothetical protein